MNSIFIPHIFENISETFVKNVFEQDLDLGIICDFVREEKIGKDGKNYYSAYILFESWTQNEFTEHFKLSVAKPEGGKVVYKDDKWFWIVLKNTSKKYFPQERKPRLSFMESPSITLLPPLPPLIKIPVAPAMNPWDRIPVIHQDFPRVQFSKPLQNLRHISLQELFQEQAEPEPELSTSKDEFGYTEEDYEQMDEIEDELNANLVSVDVNYLRTIEAENQLLRHKLLCMQSYVNSL